MNKEELISEIYKLSKIHHNDMDFGREIRKILVSLENEINDIKNNIEKNITK
jgi:hypothetical protein